ncbi:MAG: hypothetical protein HQK53_15970, partial [Oligoflexia bacterium]|nr:hypothetical protein [Oligoflexia bacterium]
YLHFQLSGEINNAKNLASINLAFDSFFRNKKAENTPLYHVELPTGGTFEFFQDVIIEGKPLYSSNSKDPTNITHPSFLKNLLKFCAPLDNFFSLVPLKGESTTIKAARPTSENLFSGNPFSFSSSFSFDDSLGIFAEQDETIHYDHVLIVDLRNHQRPHIEITDFNSYLGKLQDYGVAFCHYFGITPKISGIGVNHFREFFNTTIGKQVVQLSLNAGMITKIRSKVASILVPKFLGTPVGLPNIHRQQIKFLDTEAQDLLKLHPEELLQNFLTHKELLLSLATEYPWGVIEHYSRFSNNLLKAAAVFADSKNKNYINYANPLIVGHLIKSKCYNLYPGNADYYVEFTLNNTDDIHLPLTETRIVSTSPSFAPPTTTPAPTTAVATDSANWSTDQSADHCLELVSNHRSLVRIYAQVDALNFLKYICTAALQRPISNILTGVKIPTTKSLQAIVHNFLNLKNAFENLYIECNQSINRVIREQILYNTSPADDLADTATTNIDGTESYLAFSNYVNKFQLMN